MLEGFPVRKKSLFRSIVNELFLTQATADSQLNLSLYIMISLNTAKNILLAEDDQEDAAIFSEILLDVDTTINLSVAIDGELLMAQLQRANPLPDFIFLDLNMPRKNGLECLKEIRSNDKWKHIKVIVLSTSAHEVQVAAAYRDGADLFLTKGISYAHQKEVLGKCLQLDLDVLRKMINRVPA
jgi:CheY-like chemotaxis protein